MRWKREDYWEKGQEGHSRMGVQNEYTKREEKMWPYLGDTVRISFVYLDLIDLKQGGVG